MRADNKGEGGTLSLMALAQSAVGHRTVAVFFLGVAGAALFSGDAMITPAISVLSALGGLELLTPVFTPYILPAASRHLICLLGLAKPREAPLSSLFSARSWASSS